MSALDQLLLKKYQQSVASVQVPVAGQQFEGRNAAFEESTLDADASALLAAAEATPSIQDEQPAQDVTHQPASKAYGADTDGPGVAAEATAPEEQAGRDASMAEPPAWPTVESVSKSTFAQAIATVSQFTEMSVDVPPGEQEAAINTEIRTAVLSPVNTENEDSCETAASEVEPEPSEPEHAILQVEIVEAEVVDVLDSPAQAAEQLAADQLAADQLAAEQLAGGEGEIPPTPATTEKSFRPQWEVDRFRWPDTCCDIDQRVEVELDAAIQSLRQLGSSANKALLIRSHHANVGRSTVALCLARRAARAQLRVALVDLDFEQPSLMQSLGVATEFGVESLHLDQTTESICIAAIEDRVTLCPLLQPTQPDGEAATAMLELLIEHYDLVVIDAAPGVEALLNPRLPLGAVIVEDDREGASAAQSTLDVAEQLRAKNICTAGVVKNFAA